MENLWSPSQDGIVISSVVEGETHPRFVMLANGEFRYGDGTESPTGDSPVTLDIPKLDDDEFGNPVIYDSEGAVIPRDSGGNIIPTVVEPDVEKLEDEYFVEDNQFSLDV